MEEMERFPEEEMTAPVPEMENLEKEEEKTERDASDITAMSELGSVAVVTGEDELKYIEKMEKLPSVILRNGEERLAMENLK